MTKDSRDRDDRNRAILQGAASPVSESRVIPLSSALGPVNQAARGLEEGLRAQIRKYEEMVQSGLQVVRLDPKTIGPARFKNRDARSLAPTDPKLIQIRESIRVNGQDTPVHVFRYKDYPLKAPGAVYPYEWEIAAGRRRHAGCSQLDAEIEGGFPILALVFTPRNDQDLTKLIHRENKDREDLSPYEYGLMYLDWLKEQVYANYGEIAEAVGDKEKNAIGRYVRIAQMDQIIFDAFGDPRLIKVRWGDEIRVAQEKDPKAVEAMAAKISAIEPRPEPKLIHEALCNPQQELPAATSPATRGSAKKRRSHITGEKAVKVFGKVPLKIGFAKHKVVLRTLHLTPDQHKTFRDRIAEHAEVVMREILRDESVQDTESRPE